MPPRTLVRLIVAASVACSSTRAAADSMRCDGGIVSVGDTRLDLVAKCGPPALQEAEPVLATGYLDLALLIERWTYNFGPQRFTQVVSLQGGRIIAIDRGGYGYEVEAPKGAAPEAPPIPRARCTPDALHIGDRTFDVLARCGEPAYRDLRQVSQSVAEVWTYDFGPRTFVRYVELQGGRIMQIRTGSYGYSR